MTGVVHEHEEQDDRRRVSIETDAIKALLKRGVKVIPALAGIPITAVYAGLRPATENKAYPGSAPGRRSISECGLIGVSQ